MHVGQNLRECSQQRWYCGDRIVVVTVSGVQMHAAIVEKKLSDALNLLGIKGTYWTRKMAQRPQTQANVFDGFSASQNIDHSNLQKVLASLEG